MPAGFEGNYWSQAILTDLDLKPGEYEERGTHFHLILTLWDDPSTSECKCISRLVAKALIPCPGPVKYNSPYEEEQESYPDFIVGHRADGSDLKDTCQPDLIRSDASRALRLIFFRREVLAKYFIHPDKFTVEDGHLRCGTLWNLCMDNDHPKYVVAFLKDLGGLPAGEREHWRSFNVPPDGACSKTFYIRNIRACYADAPMPDLRLKRLYVAVNVGWEAAKGWRLWRSTTDEDRYVIDKLHVCLTDKQAEFDEQNLLLAKLLNDYLNEVEIVARLATNSPPTGGLNRLQQWLMEAGFTDADRQLQPLRTIQKLRSAGATHGKGSEYAKALRTAGLDGFPLVEASRKLFQDAVDFLEWLRKSVLIGARESVRNPQGP